MPKRRFAITGAQGVGKTTLARDLINMCRAHTEGTCELLQGIGQRVKASGYPLGVGATAETIYAFAAEHLRRERICTADIVIQDRCLVDLLAYVRVLDLLDSPARQFLQEATLSSTVGIDLIFYVPMCEALRNAKTDVETPEFRAKIDSTIIVIARDLEISLVPIEGVSGERTAKAFDHLVAAAPELSGN